MALDFKQTSRGSRPLVMLFAVAAILQVAVAPQVSVLGGRINFMLALIVTAAIGGDPRTMTYVGFAAGLLYDLTSAVPVGLMTLLLTLLGYAVASMSRGIAPGLSMDSLRLVGVGVVLVHVLNGLALFFMGVETNILMAIGGHGLSSSVLTFIVCIPFLLVGSTTGSSMGFGSSGRRASGSRFKSLH